MPRPLVTPSTCPMKSAYSNAKRPGTLSVKHRGSPHWMMAIAGSIFGLGGLSGCSEKSSVALSVMKDKVEQQLVQAAGEGEVAVELYRQQYADLKERLVKMKTLLSHHRAALEDAYATGDFRRIKVYSDLVAEMEKRVPDAERALREAFQAFEGQKNEIRAIQDEVAGLRATGMLSETLSADSKFQKRNESIRALTEALREKLRRAQALLEVNKTEESFSAR